MSRAADRRLARIVTRDPPPKREEEFSLDPEPERPAPRRSAGVSSDGVSNDCHLFDLWQVGWLRTVLVKSRIVGPRSPLLGGARTASYHNPGYSHVAGPRRTCARRAGTRTRA